MISQTAEYALRAVVFLANRRGLPATTAEISGYTRVPSGYLAKVMQALGRGGIVRSQRGLQGGFTLADDPERMTILQVVSAVDPPRRIKTCPLGLTGHEKLCPLHSRLDQAIAQIEDVFGRTTIGELIDQPLRQRKSCRFPGASVPKAKLQASSARTAANGKKVYARRGAAAASKERQR